MCARNMKTKKIKEASKRQRRQRVENSDLKARVRLGQSSELTSSTGDRRSSETKAWEQYKINILRCKILIGIKQHFFSRAPRPATALLSACTTLLAASSATDSPLHHSFEIGVFFIYLRLKNHCQTKVVVVVLPPVVLVETRVLSTFIRLDELFAILTCLCTIMISFEASFENLSFKLRLWTLRMFPSGVSR